MTYWRARVGATTLSLLLHALMLLVISSWQIAQPESMVAEPDRVVVSLAPPRAAPAPAAKPAAPPPAVAAPPPPAAEPKPAAATMPEPPVAKVPEPEPEREIPLPEQQIVSMPDAGAERPPDKTRFLSDRDNVVEKETVKRGEPAPSRDLDGDDIAAAEPDAKAAEPEIVTAAVDREKLGEAGNRPDAADAARGAGALPANRPLPDLQALLPNALALANQQAKNAPQPETASGGSPPERARRRSAVAWEPSTTLRGTLDYLPEVQPGNVTLLNTKAELFAPFVRRVMLRVFQNMMILLRRSAPAMRAGASEQVEAEAIMSPEGRMIGLRITNHSTSMSIGLDRLLTEACNEAFFDRNPPPGAISKDGNIHFVLQTVVETFPNPGQRGVALSGLFGVGLL